MSEIRRVGRQPIGLKKLFKEKSIFAPVEGRQHLPYRRSPDEEYTFENGRILINGMDILSMIEGEEVDVELLVGLVGAVDEYRRVAWERYGTSRRDFNAQTQAILEKGMNKLGATYETMTGGVRVHFTGGRLWINDIDPKVVLALFLSNPTEERGKYLKSIQTKLALILEGKIGNAHSHAITDEARLIFVQITKAMENAQAGHTPPLLAAVHNMDR